MAEASERRLELLLGRRVYGQDDRVVGRLEEFRAEPEHGYYVVTEYHLGPDALVERLAVRHLKLTLPSRAHGYRARWDQLDISDPQYLRLTCSIEELERIDAPPRSWRRRSAA